MAKITIGELMGSTDIGRLDKASTCSVSLSKVYHELKPVGVLDRFKSLFKSGGLVNSYYVIFKFNVTSGSGKTWTVLVRTNPDFDLNKWESNPAQIYCNCPDFKYRSAYVLGQRGGLLLNDRIRTELGQAVTEKPKRGTSLLCKHSYAALSWLVDNYSSIMKTI